MRGRESEAEPRTGGGYFGLMRVGTPAIPRGYFPVARWVARVAALATAFSEAVTMSLSMPTP
jgi:hypothetical protein